MSLGKEDWPEGWQEDSFARIQDFVRENPAFCLDLAPSDLVEDAYLLSLAATAFLRPDTVPEKPAVAQRAPASSRPPGPIGVPPFRYERCLREGPEASSAFAVAREGGYGAFHQAAAGRARSAEEWVRSLAGLDTAGCLLGSMPEESLRHEPVLPTLQQELLDCLWVVGRTALHAIRIGFGLWGRWDRV